MSKDIEALTRQTYDSLGFEVRDVIARSDLYERRGKDQHAFCLRVGREYPYDVRVLANVRPDSYWMDTVLHEFSEAGVHPGIYFRLGDALLATGEELRAVTGHRGRVALHPFCLPLCQPGVRRTRGEPITRSRWNSPRVNWS